MRVSISQAQGGRRAARRRFVGTTAAFLLVAAGLSGPRPAWASPQATATERASIRVRMSVFVGSRELGAAPQLGSVYSFDRLADWLVQWEPGSDNAELQELFSLRDIGEVVRQGGLLPGRGGQLETGFETGGSSYSVRLQLHPDSGAEAGFSATVEVRQDGALLAAPRLTGRFGERLMASTRQVVEGGGVAPAGSGARSPSAQAGSFLFVVVEAERDGVPSGGKVAKSIPSGPPYTVDGEIVKPPRVIETQVPHYTPEAKEARLQGVVVVAATIDREGRVAAVEVLKGLPMGLSEAAAEAVRAWRFEPATLEGEAVDVIYNLTINFRLDP